MAPDVIDLISSSPPSNHHPFRPTQAIDKGRSVDRTARGSYGGDEPRGAGSTSSASALTKTSTNDFAFLSDDFDTTVDLDEPILCEATANKRRRLSPPENEASRPFQRSVSGPAAQNARSSTWTSSHAPRIDNLDPIEFSSSLPSAPNDQKTTANTATSNRDRPIDPGFDVESDPFASSPRIPTQTASPSSKLPTIRLDESSDPFASSPPVEKTQARPRPIHTGTPTYRVLDRRRPSPKSHRNWDPISSSAPENGSFRSSPPIQSRPVVVDIEDSEGASDDELPDIANFDVTRCKRQSFRRTQSEIIPSKSRTKVSRAAPKKSAEDRTREKETRNAAKEVEKEKKRREKQEAKDAKTREKERNAALAEVNKLRTDKKVSTPEMIVDIPLSLSTTTKTQLEALLEGLDVQFTSWDSPVDNVIKWRRKVRSRFNDDLGLWEPIPLRLESEKHVLVVVTAEEFVNLAVAEDVESHITKMQEHFGNHHIVYLLEGLVPWMRKNRNVRNRQFTSGVRSQEPAPQGRRRRNPAEYIPEEIVEDALLQLQVMHDVLIHHTTIPLETAQWIAIFTQHVSTIPYKKQRDHATLGAGFCMESGQVKTGDDARDTYVRMLQEIVRVTAPIAYGIASEFGTVTELVNGLETGGPSTLEGVRKSANKDGAFSDRTVGQAVSRRMHKVFTGRDESSTDV